MRLKLVLVANLGLHLACSVGEPGEGSSGGGLNDDGTTDDGGTNALESTSGTTTRDADGGETAAPDAETSETTTAQDECPRVQVQVAAGAALNLRPTPATTQAPVASLPNRSIIEVLAQTTGEVVGGTDVWYEVTFADKTGFVSATYATCTLEEAPELLPPDGFWLPLECGTSAPIVQGNFGTFTHTGKAAYAYDFTVDTGRPMVAMADGIVRHVYNETKPGHPCYEGGGSSCFPHGNLVVLLHGDGTTSLYKHLSKALVGEGEFVPRGAVLGLAGSTGFSTEPHLHLMLQGDCGEPNCQSIPLEFVEAGVPKKGDVVTSENCP